MSKLYNYKTFVPDPRLVELGIHADANIYRFDFKGFTDALNGYVDNNEVDSFYNSLAVMCKNDLFAFMYYILRLPVNDPFIIARIYEVQDNHKNTLDLWAREHWKSMILTYALTIWTWLHKPEARQCIFSHTRTISKAFLNHIKQELQGNKIIKACYPTIFYENPEKETTWSLEAGLFIKRRTKAKEASLEAWGLVDGLPTGKHFTHRIYDDIIDAKNVTTPEQQKKAKEAYQQSVHLGARGGEERMIGTRYGAADVYEGISKEKNRIVRVYPAEVDEDGKAKFGGIPVLLTRAELNEKFEKNNEFIYSSQMLQDPVAKSEQKFRLDWVQYYRALPYLNLYIVADPAGKKKIGNDYTVICVIGVDSRRNFYLVDMIRDRLNLGERWDALRKLIELWGVDFVGYESYSMQADIDYIKERQQADGLYFHLEPLGGKVSKADRIKRLIPLFSRGRFYLPYSINYYDSKEEYHELISEFLKDEYERFPFSTHDDMLDCMARIMDSEMKVTYPSRGMTVKSNDRREDSPFVKPAGSGSNTWMSQ